MIQIMLKEVRDYFRDKSCVFFFIIFPVILVLILGNALSAMDKAEDAIGELKIHYSIETTSFADIMSINEFINGVEDNKNIFFEETEDADASIKMAGDGCIAAVVIFRNEPLEIHIYEGTDKIKNRTVNAMINGFSQINKAINVIVKSNPQVPQESISDGTDYIVQKDLGVNRTMLDYYAITMLAMLSFISIMLGSACIMGERQGKTIYRLKIASISQVKLFFAKIFGLLPQTIIQISILMILSTTLFGAHYAANVLDNLYLFLMFTMVTFTMISIGVVYGIFIDINPMAVIMPVIWVMMFLSGTYSRELFIGGISKYMPIYQVQEAAFDLAVFGRYQRANKVMLVCLSISVIMLIIGAVGFDKKEEK